MKTLWLLFCLIFAAPVWAQEQSTPVTFLSPEEVAAHQTVITRVEKYLSGLSTIIADFQQVAPDGSLSSGKFFLQRPGRMRWQYNPPTPILMVADGKELIFYDYELEQESHVALDSTMIGFMAQEKIDFSGYVGVTEFSQSAGVIRIGLAQRDKPSEGELLLEFTDKPLALRNMIVTDSTGQRTSVGLTKASFGIPLDKKLFIFMTPAKRHRKS